MKDYKMIVHGKDSLKVSQLVNKCLEDIGTGDSRIIAFSYCEAGGTLADIASADCVVINHTESRHPEWGVPILTYATDDSSADVAAINVQKREQGHSFEILHGCSIGRVFVPDECIYTRENILVAVSMLRAAGVPIEKIIRTVNGLIK